MIKTSNDLAFELGVQLYCHEQGMDKKAIIERKDGLEGLAGLDQKPIPFSRPVLDPALSKFMKNQKPVPFHYTPVPDSAQSAFMRGQIPTNVDRPTPYIGRGTAAKAIGSVPPVTGSVTGQPLEIGEQLKAEAEKELARRSKQKPVSKASISSPNPVLPWLGRQVANLWSGYLRKPGEWLGSQAAARAGHTGYGYAPSPLEVAYVRRTGKLPPKAPEIVIKQRGPVRMLGEEEVRQQRAREKRLRSTAHTPLSVNFKGFK